MAVGDRFVRRHNAARTSTSNTTAADITYDTAVISETGYTWSSPEVTVTDAGKYLFVFDLGQVDLASTRAVGTLVPSINTVDQDTFRATHRYLRNSGGSQEGASIGMAILDLAASDDVKVRNPGTGAPSTDAVNNYATNASFGGGIQMIRLNDGNFTHVERTVDAAEVGTSNINTTRPWLVGSGTWTKITYNSEVSDDGALYPGTGGDVTLAANTKYMIVWGVTCGSTDASRHTYVAGLNVGGNRVQTGSGYQRNTASQGPPMCGMYLHETGGTSETLYLEATHETEGGDAGTPNVHDAYLQIMELPADAEWIHVDNGASDSLTTALAGLTTWYDTPLSSTFRADGDSNLSLDGVNNAVQNDSGGTLPVLAIGWHRWDRDAGTSGTRKNPWTRWDNGGSAVGYGVAGAYSRGQQSSDDTWQAHYCSAVTLDLANAADLSFQVNDEASGANSDMGIYASTSRYFLGVQVLNLDTLVSAGSDITETPGTGSLTLTGYAPTLSIFDPNTNIPVPAGSLTLTGYAPSRASGLQLVGYAPTVVIGVAGLVEEPGTGSLTLTGQQPTVVTTNNLVIAVPAGALTITGEAPEILVSLSVDPPVGAVALTGQIPTLNLSDNLIRAPPAGSLALTGQQPTIDRTENQSVEPGIGALNLTGLAPTADRTENQFPEPGAGSFALTGYAPVANTGQNVIEQPDAGSLTLTGYAPTVALSDNKFISPGAGSIVLNGQQPTVARTENRVVQPGAGSLQIEGAEPFLADGVAYRYPGAGSLTLTGHAPVAQTGDSKVVQPNNGTLALTGYAPTLDLTENRIVQPGAGSLLIEGIEPFLAGGVAYRYPGAGSLTLTGLQPSLLQSNNLVVEPGAGALALTGYVPTLQILSVGEIPVPAGSLTLTGYAPTSVNSGDVAEEVEEAPSGGYGWRGIEEAIEKSRQFRVKRYRKRRKKVKKFKDELDRDLAMEMIRQQEAEEREQELQRLTQLVRQNREILAQTRDRELIAAADAAIERATFSAMERLEREIQEYLEEEAFLLQATLIILDQ